MAYRGYFQVVPILIVCMLLDLSLYMQHKIGGHCNAENICKCVFYYDAYTFYMQGPCLVHLVCVYNQ